MQLEIFLNNRLEIEIKSVQQVKQWQLYWNHGIIKSSSNELVEDIIDIEEDNDESIESLASCSDDSDDSTNDKDDGNENEQDTLMT